MQGNSEQKIRAVLQRARERLSSLLADKTTYVTGTGQKLYNVHQRGDCAGKYCVIHRPAPGPWKKWPTHWRSDRGQMERLCPHGTGHIAVEELLRGGYGVHGCCGCPCGTQHIMKEEK